MPNITTTAKLLTEVPKKYCRIILTEDSTSWHRLVETVDGGLEYRMGAGKRADMTARSFRTLVRSIVQTARIHQLEAIALHLGPMGCPKLEAYGDEWFFRTLGENLSLASYEYRKYKTKEKKEKQLKEILVCGISDKKIKAAFEEGLTIAEGANIARDIANTTG